MSDRLHECKGCGVIYEAAWKARYCERADRDPRKENARLRSGSQRGIVVPDGDDHHRDQRGGLAREVEGGSP